MVRKNKKTNNNTVILVVVLFFLAVGIQNPNSNQSIGGMSGCTPAQQAPSSPSPEICKDPLEHFNTIDEALERAAEVGCEGYHAHPPCANIPQPVCLVMGSFMACSNHEITESLQCDGIPVEQQGIINVYLTDQACITLYNPVCAEGITYPNSCVAETAGKTQYAQGACEAGCTTGNCQVRQTKQVETSLVRVEISGPDGWITVNDQTIPITLSNTNTQLIASETVREGTYRAVRLTWGREARLIYDDGTAQSISHAQKTWEHTFPITNAVAGLTRNVILDVPITEALEFRNNKVELVQKMAFATDLESRFELRKDTLGQHISTEQLNTQQVFEKVRILRERVRSQSANGG